MLLTSKGGDICFLVEKQFKYFVGFVISWLRYSRIAFEELELAINLHNTLTHQLTDQSCLGVHI